MNRIDPRISMAFGFGLQTVAGLWMLTFDLNVTMEILVINSVIQGFAVGVVWVPITAVAFGTLNPKHYAEASAVFHLLRNIGSSFFISLSIAEIVRASGANYSRMTEMITPYNRALTTGITGAWNFDTVPGLARVAKEILRQATMIGYLNAFTMYTVTSALAVPPAGTVIRCGDTLNMPSAAGFPSTAKASTDRSRATGSVPRLR
jgi:DHA2 family multidrug resistance protein